jgi:hypothetical protein
LKVSKGENTHTTTKNSIKTRKEVSKGFKFENKILKKNHSMTNLDMELILVR